MDRTARYLTTPKNTSAYITNTPKPYSGVAQGFDQNVSGTKVIDGQTVQTGVGDLPTNRRYYAPVSTAPSVLTAPDPQQIVTPVDPVRPTTPQAEPMQVKFQPGWNTQVQTPAPVQPVVDPLFKNVNPDIAKGYQNTLTDAITGKLYDPYAAGSREAMARSEANARAGTAAQVASAGFSGTGMGKQAGSATEDKLLKQRFDTNIGIEQARNASRLAALPEAMSYAQKSTEAINTEKDGAGKDFAAYVTNDPALTVDSIDNDKALQTTVQKLWESYGQTGPYDRTWAARKIQAVKDTENTYVMADKAIDYAVSQGTVKPETAKIIKSLYKNEAVLAAYDIDANGNAVPNPERMSKATGIPIEQLQTETSTSTTPEAFSVTEKNYDPGTATLEQNWSKDADKILETNPTGEVAKAIATARAKSLIEGKKPWSEVSVAPGTPLYDSLVSNMSEKYIGRNSDASNWRDLPSKDEVVKIPDTKGGFVLAKRSSDPYGDKTKKVEFKSLDGTKKYTASFLAGQRELSTKNVLLGLSNDLGIGNADYKANTSWQVEDVGPSFGSITGNNKVRM